MRKDRQQAAGNRQQGREGNIFLRFPVPGSRFPECTQAFRLTPHASRFLKGLWSLVFGLWSCILFGCSASEPPANPYSCPTGPGYTLPNYCKPDQDALSSTSIGESWVVPYALYLYTEAPTSVEGDIASSASAANPKIYVLKPSAISDSDFCATPGITTPVPCANDGSNSSAQLTSFDTTSKKVFAQYADGTTAPPEITLGIFAYDPDGTRGSGLDVSISFLATDSSNVNAGIFQSSTNLLPNGAGKKIKWLASSPTNPSQRLSDAEYTMTATGFDDDNFSFATQFKVKVCKEGECK